LCEEGILSREGVSSSVSPSPAAALPSPLSPHLSPSYLFLPYLPPPQTVCPYSSVLRTAINDTELNLYCEHSGKEYPVVDLSPLLTAAELSEALSFIYAFTRPLLDVEWVDEETLSFGRPLRIARALGFDALTAHVERSMVAAAEASQPYDPDDGDKLKEACLDMLGPRRAHLESDCYFMTLAEAVSTEFYEVIRDYRHVDQIELLTTLLILAIEYGLKDAAKTFRTRLCT
jgi:hypothetical protein